MRHCDFCIHGLLKLTAKPKRRQEANQSRCNSASAEFASCAVPESNFAVMSISVSAFSRRSTSERVGVFGNGPSCGSGSAACDGTVCVHDESPSMLKRHRNAQ
jgi:hypothetical protein